jgi:hypothetical protein
MNLYLNGIFAGVNKIKAPQRLNTRDLSIKHNLNSFCLWLLGVIESKGEFYIEKTNKDRFVWVFYIEYNAFDPKLVIYIKKVLGVGKIKNYGNKIRLVIKEKNHVRKILIPLFDQLSFLTHQNYYYSLWSKAFKISESESLSISEKIKLIDDIRGEMNYLPLNYKSPIWENKDLNLIEVDTLKTILNKHWLAGFLEGILDFYFINKDHYLIPFFKITEPIESFLLNAIKKLFHIKSDNNLILDTSDSKAIENIFNYFLTKFIGCIVLEYKFWRKGIMYLKLQDSKYLKMRDRLKEIKK